MANRSLNYNNLTPGGKYLIKGRANVYDVIDVIKQIAIQNSTNDVVKNIGKDLTDKNGDVLKNIFDYAYKNIVFVPDAEDEQNLRTVYNMIREREGNCTSYSTLISSILLSLGIPHYLRVVGYDKPRTFEHIYVVTRDGKILDPVIGQRQDGTDSEYNRNGGYYNYEVPFITKKDFAMKLNVLNGTRTNRLSGCGCGCNNKLGFTRGRNGMLRGYPVMPAFTCGSEPSVLAQQLKTKKWNDWNACDKKYRNDLNNYNVAFLAETKRLKDLEAQKKAAADKEALRQDLIKQGKLPPDPPKKNMIANLLPYAGLALTAYSLFK